MAKSIKALPRVMKAALRMIYPPQCLSCGAAVEQDGSLCPECWRDCEFVSGHACDLCGVPVPGFVDSGAERDQELHCDDCISITRTWQRGRAAMVYGDVGRDLVLALKHGDRPDLARPLGAWLARAASPLIQQGMLVVPVPLHRRRLMRRKYNQAALLSAQVAREHGLMHGPSVLKRTRATSTQDHRKAAERHANLHESLVATTRNRDLLAGRSVLVIDDVMASGATMAEASRALRRAGAGPIFVAILARAVKD